MKCDKTLKNLGWSKELARSLRSFAEKGLVAGRVIREETQIYRLHCGETLGELTATVSGRFWYEAEARSEFPAIGDWVAVEPFPKEKKARIQAILPRKTQFSRKVPWCLTQEQVVAANVDVLFLVTGLDRDFNVRRMERYLTLARVSGAEPIVVLNKSDLCPEDLLEQHLAEARSCAPGVPVLPVSALTGSGVEALSYYLGQTRTAVLVGSSGVGKSALVNALIGETVQREGETRDSDGRGCHTTTHRQLFMLPTGGCLIDSPGMREVQLWADEEAVDEAFADIEELANDCRFRDCRHQQEPGCAIHAALEDGSLDPARYDSYLRLQREVRYLARRKDQKARMEEQAKWRRIAREYRKIKIRR